MKEGRSQRNLKTAMRWPVTFSNLNAAKTSCVCVCVRIKQIYLC